MKRYVLTGGHGVGKTSLILALEQRGEYTVREAGGDFLRYQRACGIPFPSDYEDFEAKILALHILRESRIPAEIPRVFLDRGRPDHLAYSDLFHWPLPDELQQAALSVCYDAIFLVEPGNNFGVGLRPSQEQVESERIAQQIERTYEQLGYTLLRIPPAPLGERIDRLLALIDELG